MITRVRASTVCLAEHAGDRHMLLVQLRDPLTRVATWFPPGGAVEPGETPAEAAVRETLEETGLRVSVGAEMFAEDYPFTWAGVEYACTTHWYRAVLNDPFPTTLPAVVDADYHLGAAFLPLADALRELAVHPRIHAAVLRSIE